MNNPVFELMESITNEATTSFQEMAWEAGLLEFEARLKEEGTFISKEHTEELLIKEEMEAIQSQLEWERNHC